MDLTKREKVGLSIFLVILLVIIAVMYFRKSNNEKIEVISNNSNDTEAHNAQNKGNLNSSKNQIKVDINGEVNKPGVYSLSEGDRVEKLVQLSGGFTAEADTANINLAMKLKDEDYIRVPSKEQTSAVSNTQNGNITLNQAQTALININTADKEQLKELPRIGDAIAQRIIDYREKSGWFKNIEDIKNVSGIGAKMFENLKEKITVH